MSPFGRFQDYDSLMEYCEFRFSTFPSCMYNGLYALLYLGSNEHPIYAAWRSTFNSDGFEAYIVKKKIYNYGKKSFRLDYYICIPFNI